jgi:hypothetical protein
MAVQIQMRRDTAAAWTSANPVLAAGELGLETDTTYYKVGDGSTAWNSLAYGAYNGVISANTITTAMLQDSSITTAKIAANAVITADIADGAVTAVKIATAAWSTNAVIDAAGDLLIGTANDTLGRIAIGTNQFLLTSNGTTAIWQKFNESDDQVILASQVF